MWYCVQCGETGSDDVTFNKLCLYCGNEVKHVDLPLKLSDNCKICLCATCKLLPDCGTMGGNTLGMCFTNCKGAGGELVRCLDYEKCAE